MVNSITKDIMGVEVPETCRLLDEEIAHLKENSKYANDPPYMKG